MLVTGLGFYEDEMDLVLPNLLLFETGGKAAPVVNEVIHTDKSRRVLVCGQCKLEITNEDDRIEVNGGHEHSFFNPHGIVYRIGCFQSAPGCRSQGAPSSEFSWFPGYSWNIGDCARCATHLGWRFNGPEGVFFGLVLNRLEMITKETKH